MRTPTIILLIIIIILKPVFPQINFLDLIEQNIDEYVDPCEDFYRHACSKNAPENMTINNVFKELYDEEIKKYTYLLNYLNSFVNLTSLKNIPSLNLMVQDFKESCESKNQSTMIYILEQLQDAFHNASAPLKKSRLQFLNLRFDPNCERSSKILEAKIKKEWKSVIEKPWKYLNRIFNNIIGINWIEQNEQTIYRFQNLVSLALLTVRQQLRETKWTKESGTEIAIENIMNQINVLIMGDVKSRMASLRVVKDTISNCESEYKFASLNFLCYLKIETKEGIDVSKMNAFNLHPTVGLLNGLMIKTRNERGFGFMAGGTLFVLAHEIGHSIIKHTMDLPFIPHFPKDLKTCIQNQFESTCKYFKEDSCETRDEQFEENGSDIFGVHLAFDIFRLDSKEYFDKVIEGSKYNLTHGESFFYSMASQMCFRANSASSTENMHHATNARINAVTAQIPEFQRFFGCHADTKMMKSRTEQCNVIGEKAKNYE